MRMERQVLFWLAALLLTVVAIGTLRDILLPFIIGIIIAYALNPIVDRLMTLGLSRSVASATILAAGIALLAVLLVNLAPILFHQTQQLAAALPDEIKRLRSVIETMARENLGPGFPRFKAALDGAAKSVGDNWANLASVAATSLWGQVRSVFNFLSLLLVTPLVAFYMLVDWHPMLEKIDGWLPRDHAATIRRLASEINSAVAAFIRGQGVVCLILALYYAAALSTAGLEYGLLIGLVTGVLSFVPFVGWALGLLTALALAVVQFWPASTPVAIVVSVFLAGQLIDAAFLSPKIVGSRIGLHPVWLLFALFLFSYLFGFVGVLVAVPVAAALAVLVRFALQLYLASDVYTGKGTLR